MLLARNVWGACPALYSWGWSPHRHVTYWSPCCGWTEPCGFIMIQNGPQQQPWGNSGWGKREPRGLLQFLEDTAHWGLHSKVTGIAGERGEHGSRALHLLGSEGKVARVLKVYSSLGNWKHKNRNWAWEGESGVTHMLVYLDYPGLYRRGT